jgi:methyl-accepting chemotaxis protein
MKMRTQLLLGYVVVFTIMIAIAGVMYESIHSLVGTRDLVDRGYDVMANTELLMRLLVDMESGERGYALTGDEQFLKPYETARATYESTMATLKNLVMDNEQMARIAEIEAAADAWHQEAILPIIEARRRVADGLHPADESEVCQC